MSQSTFKQYYLPQKKGFDSLVLRDVPKASPKYGQILVRIKAVSLNWRDGILAIGTYPFPGPDALVPGSDGAGIVEKVGEGVTEWKAGDRVLANFTQDHIAGRLTPQTLLTQLGGEIQGLLGEYFIFPKTGVVRIPDYLSFEEASCLPCAALTAWNALYGLTPLRPGQTVLLQGTGGVSTFALQIAHAAGATAIVTSSSDEKLAKAKQLGANHTINYRTDPDWAAEAKRITDGRGVDHIIEVGGTLTLQQSFDAIAMHGIIHCIGHITNPDPLGAGKELRGPDAAFLALDRLCILRGVVVGSREQLQEMLACFESNSIRPVIDRTFDFVDVREANMGPPETTKDVRRRNGSKHDKTGCLTCRYRHKKCTLNTFPVCGACKRLNLECVRESTRQVFSAASNPTMDMLSQWKTSHAHGNVEHSKRRSAMNFYITILSQLLTHGNPEYVIHADISAAFLPMTLESPALADALVAWSAGHLASRDSCYRFTALEARSNALRSLAMSLSSHDISSGEVNAATSLILMTSEVCLGWHTRWYSHLIGAKNIIMSTQSSTSTEGSLIRGPDALKQSPEGQWILRNFAYHDILGSVTLGTQPLIPGSYLQGITDVVDTYLGVAAGILVFISDISCLNPLDLVNDYMPLNESFTSIERRLKAWVCPPGTNQALASLAHAYRSSALIYLYRRAIRGLRLRNVLSGTWPEDLYRDLHSKIQDEIVTVLRHIEIIPSSGVVESALLFPLFMAGAEATHRAHMDMVCMRLEVMMGKRHFHNIQRALEVLQGVWREREARQNVADGCDVDWKEIVDRQEGGLLLT
ncbi:hypothetical protein BO94DRAFT_541832 [Aspergillus sclerotioniger CBS 115572]|uniref:Zn(2)-C6 fungal-type domain-containing protein n=1 Tax=Aspergillus sclerotioniger CBS 115572 TaxID=1450535 RepID=A0A317XDP6_9EURO|nr:hypothetical protein BO94DRAFT_541832 [Aspergillus sclerotioniger CBS 115572]PWY95727.1 hypothetical protein BO94DRAFT_541832 [Aspergillus sclerotioniger CBS 115572]